LIGESGCGKSTLGYIISRILSPDSGSVNWMKAVVNAAAEAAVPVAAAAGENNSKAARRGADRYKVQIIFQELGGALNPAYNIRWIYHEALRARRIKDKASRDIIIKQTLPLVGLDERCLERYQHELSGGQKQRVSIMLALLMEPRLIVADEIVSSLDVSARAQILNLLRELQSSLRLSYLFISHDLDIVSYISHTIAVMYRGEIVEYGPAEAVYGGARHPYTKVLMRGEHSIINGADAAGVNYANDVADESDIISNGGCLYASRCLYACDECRMNHPDLILAGGNDWVRCFLP
jgi:oligopeptide/dipeptide ABC transporter ATP-binding protein